MFIESAIVAILIGKVRGGKFSRLSHLKFKKIWMILLALILQMAIILFGVNGSEFVLKYIREIYLISYGLLLVGMFINIKYRTLLTIIVGMGMNIFVLFSNGWKAPISVEGLLLAGHTELADITLSGKLAFYTPLDASTRYGFLGYIVTIPPPYPFPQILSIGDIFISLGLFLFVQNVMTDESYDKTKMIRFNYKSRI